MKMTTDWKQGKTFRIVFRNFLNHENGRKLWKNLGNAGGFSWQIRPIENQSNSEYKFEMRLGVNYDLCSRFYGSKFRTRINIGDESFGGELRDVFSKCFTKHCFVMTTSNTITNYLDEEGHLKVEVEIEVLNGYDFFGHPRFNIFEPFENCFGLHHANIYGDQITLYTFKNLLAFHSPFFAALIESGEICYKIHSVDDGEGEYFEWTAFFQLLTGVQTQNACFSSFRDLSDTFQFAPIAKRMEERTLAQNCGRFSLPEILEKWPPFSDKQLSEGLPKCYIAKIQNLEDFKMLVEPDDLDELSGEEMKMIVKRLFEVCDKRDGNRVGNC